MRLRVRRRPHGDGESLPQEEEEEEEEEVLVGDAVGEGAVGAHRGLLGLALRHGEGSAWKRTKKIQLRGKSGDMAAF